MVAFPMMRLVTTFFHEMGHAIPALISTKDIVEVHVGSYGEEGKAPNLQIGRLHFYLRFDVFNWNIGMCVPHGRSTWLGRLMTIIGGPIASTMICGVALFYMITQQSNPGILAAGIAMMILALIDLIVNLVPGATAYRSSEGEIQMSDGRQLVELFGQMGMSEQYHQVEALQHAGHHDQAIEKLRAMISGGDHNRKHYKLLIKSYLKNKNYQAVIDTYEQLVDHHSLVTDDYRTIGLSYLEVGNNTECVRCLNEYLYHNYSDSQANCARGLARMGLDQLCWVTRKKVMQISKQPKKMTPKEKSSIYSITSPYTMKKWRNMTKHWFITKRPRSWDMSITGSNIKSTRWKNGQAAEVWVCELISTSCSLLSRVKRL